MAKKKQPKEVSRKEINGVTFITFDDGSVQILMAPITLTQEEVASIFGEEEEEEEEEDEEEEDSDDDDSDEEDEDEDEDEEDEDDSDDSDEDDDDEEEEEEEEEDEVTGEALAEMDFDELEDLCDDKDLETDPDDFEEEDVEKLRKAIAKEMGITLPKKPAAKKETKKKGKK